MSTDGARQSLAFLWGRMARPLDTVAAVGALLGLPRGVTRQFVGATVATSAAAEELLDRMPQLLRSMSIATSSMSIRCVGEIRGPVLWSETMSARSATAGDDGIFVCSTPLRAYDTPDNQVLAGALDAIRRAGVDVDRISAQNYDDAVLRRARHNASRALRFLDHRSLASLDRRRPARRAIQRARQGHRPSFAPAMAVLERADEPIEIDHLVTLSDTHTTAQHDLLVAVVRRLESHGVKLPSFHVDRGVLRSGPVSYRHSQLRDVDEVGGVRVGSVLLDVPAPGLADQSRAFAELEARTPDDLEPVLVTGGGDVARGVEAAIRAGF